MPVQDLTEIFKKYENKWVALDDNYGVIAEAASLEEVLKISRQKGLDDPTTAFIPNFQTEYVL
ncbi:MAG: hypothetical protein HYZ86_02295 [Candidatus Omnitrophica bacterium]|nr:hypothetical protein [Candidatus Omnitrophota bacterium]